MPSLITAITIVFVFSLAFGAGIVFFAVPTKLQLDTNEAAIRAAIARLDASPPPPAPAPGPGPAPAPAPGGGDTLGAPIVDADCNGEPWNSCKIGIRTDIGDTSACATRRLPNGTDCTSPCFLANVSLACSNQGVCSSADVTNCRGYCALDYSDSTPYSDVDSCIGAFVFPYYFTWTPAVGIASTQTERLFYADYDTQCQYTQCVGQAFVIRFSTTTPGINAYAYSNTTNQTKTIKNDCVDFLNMTNTECIRTSVISWMGNGATILFGPIVDEYALNFTLVQADVCLYTYACATPNTTIYTDPHYVDKRGLVVDTQEKHVEAIRDRVRAYLADRKRRWGNEPDPLFVVQEED